MFAFVLRNIIKVLLLFESVKQNKNIHKVKNK